MVRPHVNSRIGGHPADIVIPSSLVPISPTYNALLVKCNATSNNYSEVCSLVFDKMRPGGSIDTNNRSRHSSAGEGARPTTFFLTQDPDLYVPPQSAVDTTEHDNSPVQTLKETLEEVNRQSRQCLPKHRQPDTRNDSRRRSTIKPTIVEDIRTVLIPISHPESPLLTSTSTQSPFPSRDVSFPGSPKSISSRSLQRSDGDSVLDDTGSQAITSSDEEQDEQQQPEIQDSAPQLIMPSIKMPSRRPFTARGKQLDRFKILVAGTKGRDWLLI